jgi:hypothetical protein
VAISFGAAKSYTAGQIRNLVAEIHAQFRAAGGRDDSAFERARLNTARWAEALAEAVESAPTLEALKGLITSPIPETLKGRYQEFLAQAQSNKASVMETSLEQAAVEQDPPRRLPRQGTGKQPAGDVSLGQVGREGGHVGRLTWSDHNVSMVVEALKCLLLVILVGVGTFIAYAVYSISAKDMLLRQLSTPHEVEFRLLEEHLKNRLSDPWHEAVDDTKNLPEWGVVVGPHQVQLELQVGPVNWIDADEQKEVTYELSWYDPETDTNGKAEFPCRLTKGGRNSCKTGHVQKGWSEFAAQIDKAASNPMHYKFNLKAVQASQSPFRYLDAFAYWSLHGLDRFLGWFLLNLWQVIMFFSSAALLLLMASAVRYKKSRSFRRPKIDMEG